MWVLFRFVGFVGFVGLARDRADDLAMAKG